MTKNSWNPEQYNRFEKERNKPFFDLIQLIHHRRNMSIIDLGCGTGKLTAELQKTLQAAHTLGIDSSSDMLNKSKDYQSNHLNFKNRDVQDFADHATEKYDLIFSNACLQWLPNHPDLFKKLAQHLKPEGQIAIQMPANFHLPTHTLAKDILSKPPYREHISHLSGPSVLTPEKYSELLHDIGFHQQIVRLQVYPLIETSDNLVEWVKGSLLTHYQSQLPEELFTEFLTIYREILKTYFADPQKCFLPFSRILIHASLQ